MDGRGTDVRAGQQIYFSSQGETRWGRDRRDGAEGERNPPLNPNRPLPDRPAAALIGRIGDRNEFFFIAGDTGPSVHETQAACIWVSTTMC